MKKSTAIWALLLATLVGCSGDSLLLADDNGAARGVEAGKKVSSEPTMVPISWTFEAEAQPGAVIECAPEGSGFILPANWSMTGIASHMGRLDPVATTTWFSSCWLGAGTVSGAISTILVGPNGDSLEMEGVLTLSFADGTATGEWAIHGGTGRFESATGWMTTIEHPKEDGSGSAGTGHGMITPPSA